MKSSRLMITFALSSLIFHSSCGPGGGATQDGDDIAGIEGLITGRVVTPDHKIPITGATVWIQSSDGSSQGISSLSSDCDRPPENYKAFACTGPDGSFELRTKGGLTGLITLKIKKDNLMRTMEIKLNAYDLDLGRVYLVKDLAGGTPKMAVVTGKDDEIEDVLAKLGFGDTDRFGNLILGTEKFDLYDGNDSLDDNTYPNFGDLFSDRNGNSKPDINEYDIVFINCRTEYENFLSDPNKVKIIREYVKNGGRLYVTDYSYDFVEQVFPEFIDFYLSDSTPEADPEVRDEAEKGYSVPIDSKMNVKDDKLKEWLKDVNCVNVANKSIDCVEPSTGEVHVEGFSFWWAVINGAHPSNASKVKIWTEALAQFWSESRGQVKKGTKPLTISFSYGSGQVIFSSYHARYGSASRFLPQERIFQYLVFF